MNNEFSIAGDRPPFDDGFKNDYIDIMNESKKQYKQGKNSLSQNSYTKSKQENFQEYRPKQYSSPKTQYPRGDDSSSPHYNKNRTYSKQNFTKYEQFGRYNQPQNIFGTGNRKIQPNPTNTPPKPQPQPQPDVRQFQLSPAAESSVPSFNPQPSNTPSFNPQPKQDVVSTPSPAKEQQTTPNTKTLEFPHGQATDTPRPSPIKDKKPKPYNHTHENQNHHKPKPKSNFTAGILSGII